MKELYKEILALCLKIHFETEMRIKTAFFYIYDLSIEIDDREVVKLSDFSTKRAKERTLKQTIKFLKKIYKDRALSMANDRCSNDSCIEYDPDCKMSCKRIYGYVIHCRKRI